jgi:tRNA pseudouridine38-40 synthase
MAHQTFRLLVEYDGTKYAGWQMQLNARSVAGTLGRAIEDLLECDIELGGAGRTDAGVHARGQVAHLRLPLRVRVDRGQLLRQLNRALPSDLAVAALEAASPDFHARHDAVARTYVYQIARRKSAFTKKHAWWIEAPLHVARMQECVALLPGRHDFRLFAQRDPSRPAESTRVEIASASLEERDPLLLFTISASHFLWRMVRRITGAVVKAGLGEVTVPEFAALLQAEEQSSIDIAASTAPAAGLFLESVSYPLAPAPQAVPRERTKSRHRG